MKVVFDTNTSVSGILWLHSTPAQALRFALSRGIILHSAETFSELERVLSRSKFDRYLPLALRLSFLADFKAKMTMLPIHSDLQMCRDVDDNKFLNLALDGGADYLVTGDEDLLCLDPFSSCRIVNAADFLKLSAR